MTIKTLMPYKGFAHRGLHDADCGVVENSPSAIRAALAAGVGIELDVQMSADRLPMVYHDETLYRLTGEDGRLAFMKAHEIEAISYRTGGDKIMRLDTCLRLIDGKVPLLIEVKSHWHGKAQMEEALAAILKDYKGPFGVMSFDPDVIERLKSLLSTGFLGLVTARIPSKDWLGLTESERSCGQVQFEKARQLGVDFIAHQIGDLDNRLLRELVKELEAALFSWTVDRAEMVQAAGAAGAVPIFEGEARHFLGVTAPFDDNEVRG